MRADLLGGALDFAHLVLLTRARFWVWGLFPGLLEAGLLVLPPLLILLAI